MVKRGFSLAEALVVMMIIAVFFGTAAKVATGRTKPPKENDIKGYYECYKVGEELQQRVVTEGIATEPVSVEVCRFDPPPGVSHFMIYVNGAGNYTAIEPHISDPLLITLNSDSVTFKNTETNISQELKSEDSESSNVEILSGYPNSAIYNNGDTRVGILISW